jgi:hypothetical protein
LSCRCVVGVRESATLSCQTFISMLMHKRGSMRVGTLPGLIVRITTDLIDFSRAGDASPGVLLSAHTN